MRINSKYQRTHLQLRTQHRITKVFIHRRAKLTPILCFSRIWSKWLFNICQDSFDKMVLLPRRWKNANANIWEWSSVDQNFPRNVCYLLFWALLKCNATIIYQFSCLFGEWWRDHLFLPLNFPSGKSFPKSNSWQIIIREGKPPPQIWILCKWTNR